MLNVNDKKGIERVVECMLDNPKLYFHAIDEDAVKKVSAKIHKEMARQGFNDEEILGLINRVKLVNQDR